MMTAATAAARTVNAILDQVKKIDIDKMIAEAADSRQTELQLSFSQLSEMFGPFSPDDLNIVDRHPVGFRLFRAELNRSKYTCRFTQLNDGWYFVISWKDSIAI